MKRSRIGLALSATALGLGLATPAAAAQPSPDEPSPGVTMSQPYMQPHDMLKDVLHGEGVVQTRQGPVRVAVQNGAVTAVNTSSVTVRSSDGFTVTWQLDQRTHVLDHRDTLQPGTVRMGNQIAVAGPRQAGSGNGNGGSYRAQIVLVHSS